MIRLFGSTVQESKGKKTKQNKCDVRRVIRLYFCSLISDPPLMFGIAELSALISKIR